jgi:hypothetical protein
MARLLDDETRGHVAGAAAGRCRKRDDCDEREKQDRYMEPTASVWSTDRVVAHTYILPR